MDETSDLVCQHYVRRCQFVSPCCKKIFTCRICHDEKISSHKLDRHSVKEIVCSLCNKTQNVSNQCEGCGTTFGKYFCAICRMFDDRDKGQYHCDGCGICRIGGKQNFQHCDLCGLCLPKSQTHRCIQDSSKRNCPICLEDIHTARVTAHIPNCGHLMHSVCFKKLLKSGSYRCPTCGVSLVSMQEHWQMLDDEIRQTPMPAEYAEEKVWILCNDCHQVGQVKFHILGQKCDDCGSYNTCGTSAPAGDDISSLD